MNFCFIFFVQFAIYFLFVVSDVVSEKTKFINSFNDNICVSGNSRAQHGQFCESTPLLAVPCNTKTDGSPLARGAFTRLSFYP